jgi:TPR repeat protein/peptidoglycan hydrolase-like protein with peptidoglycan-binding domain
LNRLENSSLNVVAEFVSDDHLARLVDVECVMRDFLYAVRKPRTVLVCLALAFLFVVAHSSNALELRGRVITATSASVDILLPDTASVQEGDSVEIGEDIPGVGYVTLDGEWRITRVVNHVATAFPAGSVPVLPRPGQVAAVTTSAVSTVEVSAKAVSSGATENLITKIAVPNDEPVLWVQQKLIEKGHDPGPADNKMGRRTKEAIREYQKENGMAVDGEISDSLVLSLGESSVSSTLRTPELDKQIVHLPRIEYATIQRDKLPPVANMPWYGMSLEDSDSNSLQSALVTVMDVETDGPASAGGIRKNDVLIAVSGEETRTATQAVAVLQSITRGESVPIDILREGRILALSVTPERPQPLQSIYAQSALCRAYSDSESAHFDWDSAVAWCHEAALGGSQQSKEILGNLLYQRHAELFSDDWPASVGYLEQAVYWLEKSARQGSTGAADRLAVFIPALAGAYYELGSYADALRICAPLAEKGNASCQSMLGHAYEYGNSVPRDYAMALEWYQKAADSDPRAQGGLGRLFAEGKGVDRDLEKAVHWYREATTGESVDPSALYNLGRCYELGLGVDKNLDTTASLLERAAELGHAPAKVALGNCYRLGQGCKKDPQRGFDLYHEAAKSGDVLAMRNLGYSYSGGTGVEKNQAEGARWFHQAAERGDIPSQLALGEIFRDGLGTEKNAVLSAKWYRRASVAGDPVGQWGLGGAYWKGVGVKKDQRQAVKWWREAAGHGDTGAAFNLGVAYATGQGAKKNMAEAARWFHLSAEAGDANAQDWLGRLYLLGNGVPKDRESARAWFEKAAEQGHQQAKEALNKM